MAPRHFAELLDRGLAARDFTTEQAEYRLLCDEVRISCTYGMLLCLTRPLRAAYLLGDVLGMPDTTGAEICGTTPAAFRQRLARARRTIRHVIDNRCGVVNPANPFRYGRQIQSALDGGYLDRTNLHWPDTCGNRATPPPGGDWTRWQTRSTSPLPSASCTEPTGSPHRHRSGSTYDMSPPTS